MEKLGPMKKVIPALLLNVVLATLMFGQNTGSSSGSRTGGSTPAPNTRVNPAPQSALVRILTPVAGQSSTNNAILVRYELTNPAAAAGSPNFRVQIDGSDPITTTATEYSFNGLTPG